ncbi:MAG: universal stress protein [Deltaproteobacteria bacterium]|nr:universal stress protein [Deltaproteobacteria bacterium]
MYKNILLPTDGLAKCAFGTCHGVLLAKDLHAKITAVCITDKLSAREILKIYEPEMIWSLSEGKKAQDAMAQAEAEAREQAGKALAVAEKMCADNGVPCEKVHLSGESPVDGVLHAATEKKCDLIFLSTHGNPGILGTLFGTVAKKILSASKIPVLVHHCGGPS